MKMQKKYYLMVIRWSCVFTDPNFTGFVRK